jgi:hypothetical protein
MMVHMVVLETFGISGETHGNEPCYIIVGFLLSVYIIA